MASSLDVLGRIGEETASFMRRIGGGVDDSGGSKLSRFRLGMLEIHLLGMCLE